MHGKSYEDIIIHEANTYNLIYTYVTYINTEQNRLNIICAVVPPVDIFLI